jgi:hypothetical protein
MHFHTHDTSGHPAASVLKAVEAGCDAVDGAADSMSGLTSSPTCLHRRGAAQHPARPRPGRWTPCTPTRCTGRACATSIRSNPTSDGRHGRGLPPRDAGRPGTPTCGAGRAMGLAHRWTEVSQAYAEVNQLFGDIVKVTPTSKVVGDMALFMVASDLNPPMCWTRRARWRSRRRWCRCSRASWVSARRFPAGRSAARCSSSVPTNRRPGLSPRRPPARGGPGGRPPRPRPTAACRWTNASWPRT